LPVAIVGMGIRGQMFAEVSRALPQAELVGVCDIDETAAKAAGKRFDVPHFADVATMCAECDSAAVVIATPDFAHRDAAVAAAGSGNHLLIEKPLATSSADAVAIRDAVREADVQCMIAFENHWNPPVVSVKQSAEAGELGPIVSCTSQLDDRIDVHTRLLTWLDRSTPGWFLLSHTVELAGWISGQKPLRVQASGVRQVLKARGLDTYDAIHAVVDFDGGMVGSFSSCWVLPESVPLIYQFRHEMVGRKASARLDATDQMVHTAGERYAHPSTIGASWAGPVTSPPGQMFAEFVARLINRKPLPCPIEDGLLNVAAIAAIHESIERGGPVEVKMPEEA
jgi:predicted dehydrogenase